MRILPFEIRDSGFEILVWKLEVGNAFLRHMGRVVLTSYRAYRKTVLMVIENNVISWRRVKGLRSVLSRKFARETNKATRSRY